jgi:hypothetical protein
MAVIPSTTNNTMPGNNPTTTVPPGDWAQIIIGACGLFVMVFGLVIKYRKDIKKCIASLRGVCCIPVLYNYIFT